MKSDKTEKAKALVEDYSRMLEAFLAQEVNNVKEKVKLYGKEEVLADLNNLTSKSSSDIFNIITDWEAKSLPQIDGLTPTQFFDSLDSIDDLIELTSLFLEHKTNVLPAELMLKINCLDQAEISYLNDLLSNMKPGKENRFSEYQIGVLHVINVLALPDFIGGLLNLLDFANVVDHSKAAVRIVADALVDIGEPALEKIMQSLESTDPADLDDWKNILAIVVAEIGRNNKSERIYRLLKERFRKSVIKVNEARGLALYGDSRALTVIREYAERNKKDISKEDYLELRYCILELGGSVNNLDLYYKI